MGVFLRLARLTTQTTSRHSSSTFTKPFKSSFTLKPLLNPSPICSSSLFSSSFLTSNPLSSPYFVPSHRSFTTSLSSYKGTTQNHSETDDNLAIEEWEELDDSDPEIGDGGAGGGIVLQNVPWGDKVLSIAHEVLLQFGDDIKLFAFKTTPRGYIYVRLDKLSNKYGCPGVEVLENYSRQYTKRLDEGGLKGLIPDNLGLEVSSPGGERLLRVPEDLHRFKDFPMIVSYVGDSAAKSLDEPKVFYLDSVETESELCIWKLADVKENRDPERKGRPMSRKERDWRLKLHYSMVKKVTLYLGKGLTGKGFPSKPIR